MEALHWLNRISLSSGWKTWLINTRQLQSILYLNCVYKFKLSDKAAIKTNTFYVSLKSKGDQIQEEEDEEEFSKLRIYMQMLFCIFKTEQRYLSLLNSSG